MKLLTPAEIRADIQAVGDYAGVDPALDVAERYRAGLNAIQRHELRGTDASSTPVLTFDLGDARTEKIVDSLMSAEDMKGADRPTEVDHADRAQIAVGLDRGFEVLERYSIEDTETIRELVLEVLVLNAHGLAAGSLWHVLGMVWMSPTPSWTPSHYAETLLHEGTHQSMFLHDMVNGLFSRPSDVLASSDGLIMSPIRKVARPYDFSFHAAVVSSTLIDYFERTGKQAAAQQMVDPLMRTLDQLESKRDLLTDAGRVILDRMRTGAHEPSMATDLRTAI